MPYIPCYHPYIQEHKIPAQMEVRGDVIICPTCGCKWVHAETVIEKEWDEMDQVCYCADCGTQLQAVRPGKWQCNHCE